MAQKSKFDICLAEHNLTRMDVAGVLGVTDAAVGYWATGYRVMPPLKAIRLEELVGVPRWKTRPDLWSKPDQPSAQPQKSTSSGPQPVASPPGDRRKRTRAPGLQTAAG